jgi:hypothetical protein
METDNEKLFDEWVAQWMDLIAFEIIPVQDTPAKNTT